MSLRIFIAHPSSLLTDHRPHGDGLLCYRLITELAERGHELHVAAEQVDLREPVPSNVHIYPLSGDGPSGPARRLGHMWRLRRLFGELQTSESLQIIHQLNPVHIGLSLALFDARLPIVLGPYVPDWPDRIGERNGTRALVGRGADELRDAISGLQQRRAAALLLSSPAASARVHVSPPRSPPVYELPYGIDDRAWAPDLARVPAQDVLFVGRLHVHKGVFVLIEAFEAVARRFPSARLLIAGSGPAAKGLEGRVARSPARSRIELLGGLDREQTMETVRACDVFCLPSLGEPFGLGALEAMACGRAVVVTDAGGLAHLVDDEGGRRVAPGSATALAKALSEIVDDVELRRRMGQHNRAVVEARFAWPRVVDRLELIYMEALERAWVSVP